MAFLLTREEEKQLPRVWYFPENGEWQVNNHDHNWNPFEFIEIGDFQITVFAERAKRLRQLFEAGKVARSQ